jgi:hypothetical protein
LDSSEDLEIFLCHAWIRVKNAALKASKPRQRII